MATVDGEGNLYVHPVDYYGFLEAQLADAIRGKAQVEYGPPRFRNEEIEIAYAFSTGEVAPAEWSRKPLAIRQQEAAKAGLGNLTSNDALAVVARSAANALKKSTNGADVALAQHLETLLSKLPE